MSSAAMASSSVSQEDVENDFEKSSRRSRIRIARGRDVRGQQIAAGRLVTETVAEGDDGGEARPPDASGYSGDHDASPKPALRSKEKRPIRPSHINKGKQQRDRRKLREKRRSTGVVHMPSTEVSEHKRHIQDSPKGGPGEGGSTNDDDEDLSVGREAGTCAETRRNTQHNEFADTQVAERHFKNPLRNKSVSDLDADDEDNQDCDSLGMSDTPLLWSATRPASDTPPAAVDRTSQLEEENARLRLALSERDRRIAVLEAALSRASDEKHHLAMENDALVLAMAALTSK